MRRFVRTWTAALALPAAACAQAAAEYALKSSGSALAKGAGQQYIAGCSVDTGLPECLGRTYPWTTLVLILVVAFLVVRSLVNSFRQRPG
jgi:hypothetical protein